MNKTPDKNKKQIKEYRKEVKDIMGDKEALNTLAKYTFEGLDRENIPAALMEGMMKGFTPKDFFKQNVYAIPFWNNSKQRQEYSLVTSIDYARKVAARSGMSGKSAPEFTENDNGELESCSVTVWKKGGDKRGYTATVYWDEYVQKRYDKKKGKKVVNRIWKTKPRTMLAKVAEMHALRMAFPEELQNHYSAEETGKDRIVLEEEDVRIEDPISSDVKEEIGNIDSLDELRDYWEENKGRGPKFDKLIHERQKELQDS